MSDPFLAEIRIVSFNFPPKGWSFCNGQLLPIAQNQALFSLLGNMYGGNGVQTFALPNLQGRVPIGISSGITQGELGGETAHTLNFSEMPAHTHVPYGSTAAATSIFPTGMVPTANNADPFASSPKISLNAAMIQAAGGSQPHENMAPYLVLNFIIALQGLYPTRN